MNTLNQQDGTPKVTVKILEKTFQIKCAVHEVDALQSAADTLDKEVRRMREAGVVGLDRLAIIAGLNLANDCNQAKESANKAAKEMSDRINALHRRIDEALTQSEQLELTS